MSGSQHLLLGAVPQVASDPNFEYNTLLLPGNGTNGAQNNTFLDSSTNNFTITRNGNTTQGTFSPFSQTGWGNYFDGTANGFLSTPPTTDLDLSGDFTLQAWIFPTAASQANGSEILSRGAPTTFNGWHWYYYNDKLNFGFNYSGFLGANNSPIPLNFWTHVALTRSGNTFTYYLNGVADGTFTSSGTPTTNVSDVVYVGRASYDTTNRQFPGYMAQVSVIKGTALTTFNTTTPLSTSTSGQSLLTCTSNRFIDTNTATTAKTITAGSGASVQAFSPFNPTAAWSAATYGGSGYFDGSGDYLQVANNAAFDFGSGNWTIETWVYPTSLASPLAITSKRTNTDLDYRWLVGTINTNGTISTQVTTTGSSWGINANSTSAISAGQWSHIAWVRNGSDVSVYVNGVKNTLSGAFSGSVYVSTEAVNIGVGGTTGSYIYAMNGYIADYRIVKGTAVYTAAFTPPTAPLTAITNTSLLLNYTNAGIYDATSKNNLETVGNAQISTTQSKFGGSSMYFDGTGDYLLAPSGQNFSLSGDFTVEFWAYRNSGNFRAFTIGDDYFFTGIGFYYSTSASAWRVYNNDTVRISAGSSSTSVWEHIALVKYNNTVRIYVNGTDTGSSWTSSTFVPSGNLYVGAEFYNGSVTADTNGYIDDFRITKGIARYTSNFTPPTTAFPLL